MIKLCRGHCRRSLETWERTCGGIAMFLAGRITRECPPVLGAPIFFFLFVWGGVGNLQLRAAGGAGFGDRGLKNWTGFCFGPVQRWFSSSAHHHPESPPPESVSAE